METTLLIIIAALLACDAFANTYGTIRMERRLRVLEGQEALAELQAREFARREEIDRARADTNARILSQLAGGK